MKASKRKLLELMPEQAGEAATKTGYQPGGKGIHRDRNLDDEDQPRRKKKFGEEYKAKVKAFLLTLKLIRQLVFLRDSLLFVRRPNEIYLRTTEIICIKLVLILFFRKRVVM